MNDRPSIRRPAPPARERLVTDTLNEKDPALELRLRPGRFSDFVGQVRIRERLQLFVEAARKRGDVLEHVLLSGPPGLGKTTLAHILAEAMGVHIHVTSGPVIDKPGDLAGMLTNLERGDVVFIDEIHRLPRDVEEYLYSAMEDFVLDILIDQGPNSRSVRLDLKPFTLVGATTRSGLLTAPMRSRFGMTCRLDYYPAQELQEILHRSARILNVEMDDAGAAEVSRRSRGTPRIANNLLRRVRDYAQVKADNRITARVADQALSLLDIDRNGLDEMDKRILDAIIGKFAGGPVGVGNLATVVGEEPDTIEEVYEPFLIQEGYVQRTPRGRVASPRAYQVMGATPPDAEDKPDPQGRLPLV